MISFVVGTHNRPGELKRFIEHLQEQTSDDYEVIVADEGDNEWVKAYDVTYYNQDYVGDWHYTAKNNAVSLAIGDYLCFPQDDAVYQRDFVEKMQSGELNVCGWKFIDCEHPPKAEVGGVDIGGFTVLTELFDGFDGSSLADGNFVVKLRDKVKLIPEILYEKR